MNEPGPTPPDDPRIDPASPAAAALLARMQAGDREAVGEFIDVYGDRIRRRVRGQLRPSVRRVVDSQEILSTVARRLDELVHARRLRASEEAQLWSLVFRIATNAIIDKSLAIDRLRRVEGSDRAFAQRLLSTIQNAAPAPDAHEDGADEEITRILDMVLDPIDRQVLEMWLRDQSHVAIAAALDLPQGTVRRRWAGIKARLEPRLRER